MPTDRISNANVERRLAAILAADIAGYSTLMGADEEATVRDLQAHQNVILPMIKAHSGRVIDTAGDGILAEFASVLNALKCALAVQREMADRNAETDLARRMQFRIGVNQGDALQSLRDCVSLAPNYRPGHVFLAATYAQLGRLDEAKAEAAEVLRIDPDYKIAGKQNRIRIRKRREDSGHLAEGLRKAGLPER
jgi:tetratricopeptide (TPR) repeat protein